MTMINDVGREADLLASAGVDIIVYGCSSCSLIGGLDWEKILIEQMDFETGIRSITVNQAVVEAINSIGGGKVGVITPYDEKLCRLEKEYLESWGLGVTQSIGMGLHDPFEIANVGRDEVMGLVEEASVGCDVLYISCTNLPVIHLIDEIEASYGLPVITSNQAALWYALGDREIAGYGQLFNT
jgi:maleate isomerase